MYWPNNDHLLARPPQQWPPPTTQGSPETPLLCIKRVGPCYGLRDPLHLPKKSHDQLQQQKGVYRTHILKTCTMPCLVLILEKIIQRRRSCASLCCTTAALHMPLLRSLRDRNRVSARRLEAGRAFAGLGLSPGRRNKTLTLLRFLNT